MATAKDPICGMDVNTEAASATSTFEGKTYYFCCNGCKTKFEQDPAKYAGGAGGHGHDHHDHGHHHG